MTAFGHVLMALWIPIVVAVFYALPPRRAVLTCFVVGWLFLPVHRYVFEGLPEYTKTSATCAGILLAALIFDWPRIRRCRFRLFDLPVVLWCLSPILSSLANDLGLYDGISEAQKLVVAWGMPYLIGRIYFSEPDGLHELAVAIFIGGLVYMPLCLWEMRMSPQLHRLLYGYHQHSFLQTIRGGGYRPMVFMEHGLMVGTWMTTASLVGVWLWVSGRARRIHGWRTILPLSLLVATTLFMRFGLALLLVLAGFALLFATHFMKTRMLMLTLLLAGPAYMFLRTSHIWSGQGLVTFSRKIFAEQRAQSLQFRLDNETLLVAKAMQRPVFGWGGWGRSRVHDKDGNDISVTDALWVIAIGKHGIFGLTMVNLLLLLPGILLWLRNDVMDCLEPPNAPAVVFSVVLMLYVVDNLFNAMINPFFTLIAGGLVGYVILLRAAPEPNCYPTRYI